MSWDDFKMLCSRVNETYAQISLGSLGVSSRTLEEIGAYLFSKL